MLRVLAAVVLVGGCGRIGFAGASGDDARDVPDAALGNCPGLTTPVHDEDGDGVGDPCDVCPHQADTDQADVDLDGVGDACDREPGVARQHLVFFDPFLDRDARWEADDSATFEADQVHTSLVGTNLRLHMPAGDIDYEIGGEVIATAASPALQQVFLGVSRDGNPLWYGEIYDDQQGERRVTVLYYDTDFTDYDTTAVAQPFTAGPFRLRLSTHVTTPTTVGFHAESAGRTWDVGGAFPEDLSGGNKIHIWSDGFELAIHYAVLIETQ